jgi:integrative and conjugative element protein (TIGR02256 family)
MSRVVLSAMHREAHGSAPYETGGVLIGYWASGGTEAVVTAVIGPGADAEHELHSFRPDYVFQEGEIARLYEESRGRETYLGDWHTHPDAPDGRLSGKDRRTLWRIATFKEARAERPLMAVMHGGNPAWDLTVWQGRASQALRIVPCATLAALEVREYGDADDVSDKR